MAIEMGRKYRTRDGREVMIYAVDGGGDWPVHGAIKEDWGWLAITWNKEGRQGTTRPSPNDLIEIKPSAIDGIIEWLEKQYHMQRLNSQFTGAILTVQMLDSALTEARRLKAEAEMEG